jgi:DNA-directed RNA polymerase specialized sigma24 family protein
MAARHQHWSAGHTAFRRFLEWLDEGADSGGQRYLEIRRRLVSYFDRKNCLSSDELADETLDRVVRRLDEEGAITCASPAHYCYIIAKYVFLEYQRQPLHRCEGLDDASVVVAQPPERGDPVERRFRCLDRCLERLKPEERELIVEYYRGDQRWKIEHRRRLAAQLNLTANALSIRACRIRERLEKCVKTCSERR